MPSLLIESTDSMIKKLSQLLIHCIAYTYPYPLYLPTYIYMYYTHALLPPPPTHTYTYTQTEIHHPSFRYVDYLFSLQCMCSYFHIIVLYTCTHMRTHIYAHINLLFRYTAHSFIDSYDRSTLSFTCMYMYHMTNYFMFTLMLGVFTSKHIADSCRHMHTPPHTHSHMHACTQLHIHTHIYSPPHIHVHTYTHTHTHACT